jgi:methyl-accepting chemotaxis protein
MNYENTKKYDSGVRYGDYYLLPKERSKECIIDPFPSEIQGNKTLLTSLVSPIIVDNKFYGIAGIDIKLDFLQGVVKK